MPFCFLSVLNGTFNLLIFVQVPILVPYTIVTSLLGFAEIFGAWVGWQIYKIASAHQLGAATGVGSPFILPGPGSSNRQPQTSTRDAPLRMFQGQGHRLGDYRPGD